MWLLAPRRYASALVGPGGIRGVIDWDAADVAALLGDADVATARWARRLRRFVAAIVYSDSQTLARSLTRLVDRTVTQAPLPPPAVHAATWYVQPVVTLAPHVVVPGPCQPTRAERCWADEFTAGLPARFLAVHAGSGSARKNWPADRFAALIAAQPDGAPWLLVEGPAETGRPSPLRSLPGARLARDLPPRRLGAVLARAGAYVGNDSGVTHLAASWGTPTVALFGPTDPRQWAPPPDRTVRVLAAASGVVSDISVDEVLSALAELR